MRGLFILHHFFDDIAVDQIKPGRELCGLVLIDTGYTPGKPGHDLRFLRFLGGQFPLRFQGRRLAAILRLRAIADRRIVLRRSRVFEAEKNKLTFDSEIEAAYLVGRFAVGTPGEWEPLPRDAARYEGPFVVGPLPETVALGDLTPQGLPAPDEPDPAEDEPLLAGEGGLADLLAE